MPMTWGAVQIVRMGTTMAKHKNARPTERPYLDREWLRQKYHDENMLQIEIAALIGVTCSTIGYWLTKHNIERRGGRATWLMSQGKSNDGA
jgi:hypothetical protein